MGLTLIADGGSTKTAWRGFAGKEIFFELETDGLNPVYMGEQAIIDDIEKNLKPFLDFRNVERLYFYGAGCHSSEMQMKMQNALSLYFSESMLNIHSDMEGAAIGLHGRIPGIACIIGTGSNSCYWDGKSIQNNVPALGFIIGDEGSGAWMGKRIAADYLRNGLPVELAAILAKDLPQDLSFFIRHIYQNEYAGRFLASLTGRLMDMTSHPYMTSLMEEAFAIFFRHHISRYEQKGLPIGFVGSIALKMKDIIMGFCREKGYIVGSIVSNPLDGIQEYLREELYPEKSY